MGGPADRAWDSNTRVISRLLHLYCSCVGETGYPGARNFEMGVPADRDWDSNSRVTSRLLHHCFSEGLGSMTYSTHPFRCFNAVGR